MTVPTAEEDLQPHSTSTKWRVRLLQLASVAGPGVLTVYMPALGTPVLVVTGVILIWVERGSKK